jgi:hypothetical protein
VLRILSILAVVLVLSNARCFVRCQLDSADRSAPPCHSQGHSQTKLSQDHCIEQHELGAAAGVPHVVVAGLPSTSAMTLLSPISLVSESVAVSPPFLKLATSKPLRI